MSSLQKKRNERKIKECIKTQGKEEDGEIGGKKTATARIYNHQRNSFLIRYLEFQLRRRRVVVRDFPSPTPAPTDSSAAGHRS